MPNSKKGLAAGTPAPDFTLPASDGLSVRLSTLRGQWVVLFFFRGTQ
ncbi:MAG: hypothetical protein OJF49_004600 [Ktedonobacterales bacterium]|nr:MAG: hypothetical protein OJF49_004600 [Ktedonobacterales bacterium]